MIVESFVSSAWLYDSAALHVAIKLLRSDSPEIEGDLPAWLSNAIQFRRG